MTTSDVQETLKKASNGLLFQSETDAPFEVIQWPGEKGKPAKPRVLELAGAAPSTTAKTQSLDAFFDDATQEADWHDNAEKAAVERFQQLVKTLKETLKDTKVFLVGKGSAKDAYIVGRSDGGWAGLRTQIVET